MQIDNPNELDEIYDSITYAKSNCVNRMLCEYLGEETFQVRRSRDWNRGHRLLDSHTLSSTLTSEIVCEKKRRPVFRALEEEMEIRE